MTALGRRAQRNLWGAEMSMVFQDPMTALNPVLKIGNQITEGLRHHLGVDRKTANEERRRPAAIGRHPRARAAPVAVPARAVGRHAPA